MPIGEIIRALPEYGLEICGGGLAIIGMLFGLPAIIGHLIGGPGEILELPHRTAMKGSKEAFNAAQKYSVTNGTLRKS